jgi:hypothetical protein
VLMEGEGALDPHIIAKLNPTVPLNLVVHEHRIAFLSGYLPCVSRRQQEMRPQEIGPP